MANRSTEHNTFDATSQVCVLFIRKLRSVHLEMIMLACKFIEIVWNDTKQNRLYKKGKDDPVCLGEYIQTHKWKHTT